MTSFLWLLLALALASTPDTEVEMQETMIERQLEETLMMFACSVQWLILVNHSFVDEESIEKLHDRNLIISRPRG
jgi:hypothetical protein